MFDLYVVTDSDLSNGKTDAEIATLAYEGGADAVQLRMKHADGREMLAQARAIAKKAEEMDRFFFVNDRVDIAMASGADGVHLGQSDIPVEVARSLMGEDAIIGISVQTVDQAVSAVEGGADYLGVGSIFRTSTKPDAVQGLGLDAVFEIRRAVDVPVVAIGGINRGNIQDVIRAGADSAAVVSAVVAQDDPRAAAHELRDLILKVRPNVPANRCRCSHALRATVAFIIINRRKWDLMRSQEDYLRDFAVLMTEKGVVAVSDPQQIAVYDFLCGGKKRPSDIAEALGLPSSSLHFILDKMVDSGIIVRSKPDPAKKEVYYSVLALRIVGSTRPTPERIAESQETFSHLDSTHTGLASVAEMLESYLGEIGLDHDQLRTRYVRDLAAASKDTIGSGTLESVMQSVKDCFHRLTGFRLSVFALNPPTIVFEGDRSMRSKMDMLSMLVKYMMENATGRTLAVRTIEDFSNQESARFKVVYDRADPGPEPYINTSLPQLAEPERFFVVEIDGAVALIMNDIQNRLIDAIYERPLCVTDVVNAVNMPRSTVTTNLLRMVEEGVASVFYSESGAMYYGLSCSILMKRTRRASKDSTPTRNAIKLASKDGGFMEGYMLYLIASLQELGFDTDYMMVVLGAKYMRAAGQAGPKNFDSYFGTMSDIAKVVGLSLSVVSVYPLTIGISGSRDEQLSPAMTFVKGMAHQGLEMASSGIFVRVSEETPDDMKVSFKEIYPSLSADPAKVAEIAGVSDPAPVKKRTSSIRDALRNRSAKTDGRPVRSVRYITGIAMVIFAAMVVVMAMGGAVDDNTASAESYDLSVDPSSGIVLYAPDGAQIETPCTVKADETVTFRISADCVPGVVKNGVAYPLEDLYPLGAGCDAEGNYTIALEKDITLVEVRQLSADLSALAVGIYDFGCEGSVGGVSASSFDRYIPMSDYAGEGSEIWSSGYAWVSLVAGEGEYLSFGDDSGIYTDHACIGAWSEGSVTVEDIPSGTVALTMTEGTVFECDGVYYSGSVRIDRGEDVSMRFASTDGPVSILLDVEGSEQPVLMNRDRFVTLNLSSDATLSFVHVEFY